MSEAARTVLVSIRGRVQGVWFRGWTKRQADGLLLAGWVRNRADHSVEALFSGDRENVDKMISKCHKGSPLSRVNSVTVIEQNSCDLQGFEIRETG